MAALELDHVSKRYSIGPHGGWPLAKRPSLWALRDIDLGVKPGESVGLIGHNGAGKTTLLRLVAGSPGRLPAACTPLAAWRR